MRLEKAAGVELGEAVLAEADTPRQLAAAIARAQAGPRPGISPGDARPFPGLGPASARPAPGLPPAFAHPGPGRGPATAARTLIEALRWQVERGADRVHIQLRNDDGSETLITYGSLYRDACGVAAGLRDRGVAPGERVALLLRTEPAFFHAYMGILLAGGVPVPLYPPFRADQIEEYAVAPGRDPAQRGRPRPADVRRGRTRRRAPAPARPEPDHGRHGGGPPTRLRSRRTLA